MSALYVIVLLSALSQTFAQGLQDSPRLRLVFIQNRAPTPGDGSLSSPDSYNNGGEMETTDLNSPILSKFAAYNLQVQKEAGVFPRIFDVSFPSDAVRENFYNEGVYFCLENGVYDCGSIPEQLADAAEQAFPYLTPLEVFKVTSNTLELTLQHSGIGTEGNYQVLTRLYAKAFKDAMDMIKVNDGRSALHAVIVGAGVFYRSIGLDSPDSIRFSLATYADQFSKVPRTRGLQ